MEVFNSMTRTLYSRLNVTEKATLSRIRLKYMHLCEEWGSERRIALEGPLLSKKVWAELGFAFQILSDKRTRRIYDDFLSARRTFRRSTFKSMTKEDLPDDFKLRDADTVWQEFKDWLSPCFMTVDGTPVDGYSWLERVQSRAHPDKSKWMTKAKQKARREYYRSSDYETTDFEDNGE